ncbi:DNA-binding protein [Sulfolobus sp. E5-1-F]|uniref:Zn-ribbon domain-containing OB-fold protein n=1 Tax=Sulfolobaceae TaxID=118883 RepID=UPI001297D449|nr:MULTISPECIES: Zn-ribbon domain-containing OB-fold protein [unclassified Sulfolobus]QGA54146.1 DNA-binding protein [Sulfolobus sp. E5-1-F]QGA69203.1 DNA-binding protein [Sulfolobus sp. E11-6]
MSWEKSGKEGSLLRWYDIMEAEKYEYTVGPAGEQFFNGLKQSKIVGSKCSKCGRIYVPARSYCEHCFVKIENYVEINKDEAYVDSYTIIYNDDEGNKLAQPVYIVLIRFPNVEGGLLCYAEGNVKVGAKAKIMNFQWPLRVKVD